MFVTYVTRPRYQGFYVCLGTFYFIGTKSKYRTCANYHHNQSFREKTFCRMPDKQCFHDIPTWASCQIRKIAGCACAGNAGNVSPKRLQRKSLVSDPGVHHGTCVTHVPWCMSGSLTHGGGENVPGIPGACATYNFAYLVRGPWSVIIKIYFLRNSQRHLK